MTPSPPDPFFDLPAGSEWNACIGRQGHEEHYVDGYIEAALALTTAILEKRLYGQRDTLVLPILYSARHAVELTLKFVTRRLQISGALTSTRLTDHDIAADYEVLAKARLGDAELKQHINALAPYVKSLAAIDRDGQMLRYARSRDGTKSLADKSLANIEMIHASCGELQTLLGALKYRTVEFIDERKTGTFTADRSRQVLMEITRLPRAAIGAIPSSTKQGP